jgi:hypothetical protein
VVDLSWQFRERCEGIATRWRDHFKLHAYDPLPANRLAEKMNALLCRPADLDASEEAIEHLSQVQDWSGIIKSFSPLIILYNPTISSARYESTIMHELSHIILQHPPGQLYLATSGIWEREFDSKIEAEAAYLGSCLQIPRRALYWSQQRKMDIDQIATHFGASIEMVRWRMNANPFTNN